MDRSFEGLLLSIFVHIALFLLLWNAKFPHLDAGQDKTEVTIVDRMPPKKPKAHWMVPETEKTQATRDFKDDADFLAQFTKRVKKQLKAANTGPHTINAAPRPNPTSGESTQNKVAGIDTPSADPEGELHRGSQNETIHNLAVGQSTISNVVPGVEEGAFTALNTDQFTYYTFFSRMNEQVRNRWIANLKNYLGSLTALQQETLAKRERRSTFEFLIDPKGDMNTMTLQQSSGDRALDQTFSEAFRAAAPFPNPPRGMIEPDGFIHLRYGFVLSFVPPGFRPASTQ